ncbi:hypothetical protein SAMN05216298_3263 [Glycomyces sambucus]|uniref:Uncharacterized protein n=1 Tax=Glycomyces sambucus TaxID=380244 RepID=A0A1G9IIJ5_9ACTN|nr:hypothetical protein SAMN05216298_3263 [Glycomyces sambucus]
MGDEGRTLRDEGRARAVPDRSLWSDGEAGGPAGPRARPRGGARAFASVTAPGAANAGGLTATGHSSRLRGLV